MHQDVVHRRLEPTVLDPQTGRRVALRVEVDDQDPLADLGQARAEVDRRGGLADAALLVGDRDHPRQLVVPGPFGRGDPSSGLGAAGVGGCDGAAGSANARRHRTRIENGSSTDRAGECRRRFVMGSFPGRAASMLIVRPSAAIRWRVYVVGARIDMRMVASSPFEWFSVERLPVTMIVVTGLTSRSRVRRRLTWNTVVSTATRDPSRVVPTASRRPLLDASRWRFTHHDDPVGRQDRGRGTKDRLGRTEASGDDGVNRMVEAGGGVPSRRR